MRTGFLLLTFFLSLGASAIARAEDEGSSVAASPPFVDVNTAHVILVVKPDLVAKPQQKLTWERACNALGQALREDGAGPWGLGPFSDYRCAEGDADYGRGPGESLWRLLVAPSSTKGGVTVQLEPVGTVGTAGQGRAASSVHLGAAHDPLELLAHPELARRLAATLTDGMPMMARVGALPKEATTLKLKYPAQVDADQGEALSVPPPPKRLNFYELRWDDAAKLWRPRIIGGGRLGKLVDPKDEEGEVGSATYALDPAVVSALAAKSLWAHDARGAGAGGKEWRDATKALYGEIAAAQADRLSSPIVATTADVLGYVGVRYGMQILTGNKLLEQTSFLGLLVELRSGPLSGLQYYFDVLPQASYTETSVADAKVDSEIAWSRHVLGYTFRIPFPWLIDRVTLTPKFGIWSLRAQIPGEADARGRVDELRQFEIKEALSAGAEIGFEYLAARFALKPWGGVDTSLSVLGEEGSVTSRRLGLDLYVAGPSLEIFGSPVRVALLGFSFVENVALTNGPAETNSTEVGEDGVRRTIARKIEYSAGYAGLGLALSW